MKKLFIEFYKDDDFASMEEIENEVFKDFLLNQLNINDTFHYYDEKYIIKDKYEMKVEIEDEKFEMVNFVKVESEEEV